MKELNDFSKNPLPYCQVSAKDGKKLLEWDILLLGPQDSPYEGGKFELTMKIHNNYPLKPPKIKFKTSIWHMNVNKSGSVCIPALSDWNNKNSRIKDVIQNIYALLKQPSQGAAINDIAWAQYYHNSNDYQNTAKDYTQKYAMNTNNYNDKNIDKHKDDTKDAIKDEINYDNVNDNNKKFKVCHSLS